MKAKVLLIIEIFLLGVLYLILPSPKYPDLTNGARSDEPGDTWQHPDQKGYYSNDDRATVLSDIQSQFSLKLDGITIPSYRLNYRPEESYDYVRDQLQSYYLEEIIYPLRESIFVNGWEPKKAPKRFDPQAKAISDLSIHGIVYNAKITLRPVNSSTWARLLIWTLIFPSVYLVYLSFKKSNA